MIFVAGGILEEIDSRCLVGGLGSKCWLAADGFLKGLVLPDPFQVNGLRQFLDEGPL